MDDCIHCGDIIKNGKCPKCDKEFSNVCMDCHKEKAHNMIKNQNIHICGGMPECLDDQDYDVDAYAPCWKYGN